MDDDTAWRDAMAEHDAVIARYLTAVEAMNPAAWHLPIAGRTWSAADETHHLVRAYELALGDGRMRMQVSPAMAWVLRTFYLRYLFWRKTFHRGARAPSEVRPNPEEARTVSKEVLIGRLRATASAAVAALESASKDRPDFRVVHAYFGALSPLDGLRMLTAHTRHHTRASAAG